MFEEFEEIRKICLEDVVNNPENLYHLVSNLNWSRYVRQIKRIAYGLPKNACVIDIGCEYGFIAAMLSILRPDLKIYSVDLKPMETWGKLKKHNVKFQTGNGMCLNFRNNTFDAVLTFGVLEHVEDNDKFLKEVKRVLKKNGKFFIFNLPNKYSMPEFLAKRMGVWHHETKYSIGDISYLLSNNNFKIVEFKIEFLIPAQVERVNKGLANMFNHTYGMIQKIDDILTITPLKYFAQSIYVECVNV